MGTLILLNDVETDLDEASLVAGSLDTEPNHTGNNQADIIADYFWTKIKQVDLVFSSPAIRVKKLTHKIRTKSPEKVLTSLHVRQLDGLKERDFGVLNGTSLSLGSDLFTNTRIKAEKGESVLECRVRLIKCIDSIFTKYSSNKTVLIVSHPFSCQILFNALLQKEHTMITSFWMNKGSFASISLTNKQAGWSFQNAYNAFANTAYTQDEIYRQLLRK